MKNTTKLMSASIASIVIALVGGEGRASANTYEWTSSNFLGNSGSPGILGDSSAPLTLSSSGGNAVTVFPSTGQTGYYFLGNTANAGGQYELYVSLYDSGGSYYYTHAPGGYFWGLSGIISSAQYGYGWTSNSGKVWELPTTSTGWGTFYTSVATVSDTNIYLTDSSDATCSTDTPAGPCIYNSSGSTPSKWNNFGAIQVAVDSTQTSTDLFAIGTNNVVYYISTGGSPSATAITTSLCGGGTLTADQIAVKGGVVFAINDNSGSGGTIYEFVVGTDTCWTHVGSKTNFAYSIATDSRAGQSGPTYSDGYAVVATDDNDTVWFACYGTGTCTDPWSF